MLRVTKNQGPETYVIIDDTLLVYLECQVINVLHVQHTHAHLHKPVGP